MDEVTLGRNSEAFLKHKTSNISLCKDAKPNSIFSKFSFFGRSGVLLKIAQELF